MENLYPIAAAPNGRHTVDRSGAPFLIHGDTAWSLITGWDQENVTRYLADRQRKGFNSVIVNLIEHKFNGPTTRTGELPFAAPGDFARPNEAYFDWAEWCVAEAARHGLQVFLAPIYLGYPHPADDDGWYHEALAVRPGVMHEYGAYVSRRFGKFDNLVWLMGGDRNPGAALEHVNAVAAGIRQHDQRHLFTAHTLEEFSPAVEYASGGWLSLNCTYTYGIVHRKVRDDCNRFPTLPLFLIESTYEGEHNATPVQIRRQAYWALLSGATGHFFGNNPIWGAFEGWEAALDSPGAWDMMRLAALLLARRWHTLVPDQQHAIVTKGLGELRGLDTLTAALTADRGTLIVYMPTARPVAVCLEALAGKTANAWWFDPRTGAVTFGGEFVTRGEPILAPPGDGDWVLVLDDTAQNLPPPGMPEHA